MGHNSFVYLDDGLGSQPDRTSAFAAAFIQRKDLASSGLVMFSNSISPFVLIVINNNCLLLKFNTDQLIPGWTLFIDLNTDCMVAGIYSILGNSCSKYSSLKPSSSSLILFFWQGGGNERND